MPKPIVCLSVALVQFAEVFRPCFSHRQWKYFVIVLLGLIECDGRRTLRGLLTGVGEKVSLCGLSRFFSRWCWSTPAVAQTWLGRFREQLKPQVQAEHRRQRTERSRKVRRAAQKRGWEVSGGLKSNRTLRQLNPDGSRTWLKLADYVASLKAEAWQQAVWPSQEGDRPVYLHTLQTWIRKLGPTLLLITCHAPDNPGQSIRCWGSTLLEADAQTVINTLAVRWSIEVLFEDNKDLLGADHYQRMSAEAILRFWTLIACLGYFLDEQKALRPDCSTWGDVRRALQKEHQHNLLSWLQAQFQAGLSAEQVGTQLAIFSS